MLGDPVKKFRKFKAVRVPYIKEIPPQELSLLPELNNSPTRSPQFNSEKDIGVITREMKESDKNS